MSVCVNVKREGLLSVIDTYGVYAFPPMCTRGKLASHIADTRVTSPCREFGRCLVHEGGRGTEEKLHKGKV